MSILRGYYLVQVGVIICSVFATVLKKKNLNQIVTPQEAKLGPDNNSTTYVCMYVCMCIYIYI